MEFGAAIGVLSGVAGGLLMGLDVAQLPTIGGLTDAGSLLAALAGALLGAVVGDCISMLAAWLEHAPTDTRPGGVFLVVQADAPRSPRAADLIVAPAPGA